MIFRILDGGAGSELHDLGYHVHEDPLWSARLLDTNPGAIKQLHKSYLEAGADTIITVTYQATVAGFEKFLGVSTERATELIKSGVSLAREACHEVPPNLKKGTERRVAGSVGPYGVFLHDGSEYSGYYVESMTQKELIDWHRPQVTALLDGGVDMLAVETIPALKEAEAILELLKEFPTAKAYFTFSCKDGKYLCHGEKFSEAIQIVMSSDQVIAAGINCTHPSYISELLDSLRPLQISKPIIVKPNSGEGWKSGVGWCGRGEQSPLEAHLTAWVDKGATWIGGCCRIKPHDIKTLKEYVEHIVK
ncbi:homocysteine S-methyltransferase YbgG-like isoform X1 [Ostrea edulis]|uniref:homocysteine S-methyltransferase YbgG-like isoform X1 n=1 Tax=Ostrea edulis TaxID=37623 RepID=UPI0024AFB916|nr:homocysteine S-methyltransferase YbgG-like isoform X1 [Ostrea edulis]